MTPTRSFLDLDRARALMEARGLDAVIAYGGPNFYYLTGFQNYFDYPATSWAVLPRDAQITPFIIVANWVADAARAASAFQEMYTFPLQLEVVDAEAIRSGTASRQAKPTRYDAEGIIRLLADGLSARGLAKGTIGLELNLVSAQVFDWMKRHLPEASWRSAPDLFVELRGIKTPEEVEYIREATRYAEHGLKTLASEKLVGLDVSGLKLIYDEACIARAKANPESGFQGTRVTASVGGVTSPVLTGGPRVQGGDLVFFDCGASVRGYGSDTGRTLTLSEPSREMRKIMDALRAGMDAAFALVGPGARMCDIFNAGQETVRASGLDWYTRGHIGHAMGLGMGEIPPFISAQEQRPLEVGMVMAIETPLYVRGLGGFQIEECFVVTARGYDCLTTLPRDFMKVMG